MIIGEINSTYTTQQRDMFESGLLAEIGANAFTAWSIIKYHADYKTGEAYPGLRSIAGKMNISKQTAMRALETLENAHLLRVVAPDVFKKKGKTYIARERLTVKLGKHVLCTIVVDYVPLKLKAQIKKINTALQTGEHDPDAWAQVEIIPGDGFIWDEKSKTLKASIRALDFPVPEQEASTETQDLLRKIAPNMSQKFMRKN
ncbi:MAG: hypothetical protein Q7T66_07095 [Herminiimonas sp.]|uniref:helix-turn-helix domain-containing protein n=1 Tax=Herminiimonas sp. TaxID=1926289 RepID=UPI00271BD8CD|nr:helix-turn-helix domain-containing protein [Herminiimonas sp.]MDO9420409.1 hypothetical protein [Herminiimonas sp.]